MNIIIGPLEAFYIEGSLILLFIAIIIYPTLSEREREKNK